MAITTPAQARRVARQVADLLWARVEAGTLTFERAESASAECIALVFDHGVTPAAAVACVS